MCDQQRETDRSQNIRGQSGLVYNILYLLYSIEKNSLISILLSVDSISHFLPGLEVTRALGNVIEWLVSDAGQGKT